MLNYYVNALNICDFISYIIYLFAQKFTRNSKCWHAEADLDGKGSKGALTVAYKIKMEYNMNQ